MQDTRTSLFPIRDLVLTALVCALSACQVFAEAGQLTQEHHEYGEYMRYIPAGSPEGILVIVHGSIGEDDTAINAARVFINRWTEEADQRCVVLLAPAFDQANFGGHAGPGGGYRGLFGRHVSADVFVNAIVDATREQFPELPEKFLLYGHSAGGQFVSRYLVTHPERIEAAVISSAGSFAFPDPDAPWANGMKRLQRRMRWSDDDPWGDIDITPDPSKWLAAAQLPVTVVVGSRDLGEMKEAPGNPGTTHVARGRYWKRAMNNYARKHKKRGRVRAVIVDGIGHNSKLLTPACIEAFWGN